MSPVELVAAVCVGVACVAASALVVRPTARLAPRVRPYAIVARTALGRSVEPVAGAASVGIARADSVVGRLFGPPLEAITRRAGRFVAAGSDEQLARRLRAAGWSTATPEQWRARVVGTALAYGTAGGALGLLAGGRVLLAGALAVVGVTIAVGRARGRLDRAIEERRERIRLELYTVNQLLALHIRTGAGPVQAAQRLVDRGHGAVVEELDATLSWIHSGLGESEAFRRAAELTPEPAAARTYKLFAAGAERGVDLAAALLALSEDVRDARREEMRKTATKRRAAMLVPTIAVLAPIMLLFIAAPIPSIVFGGR